MSFRNLPTSDLSHLSEVNSGWRVGGHRQVPGLGRSRNSMIISQVLENKEREN